MFTSKPGRAFTPINGDQVSFTLAAYNVGPGGAGANPDVIKVWDTAPNGLGLGYNPGDTFPMSPSNVPLYAQWHQ